jgi:indoleamine 2,3-dioxygenase
MHSLRFLIVDYGLAKSVLPRNISIPLCYLAEKLGAKPWLEYAQSYALSNWRKRDQAKGMQLDNLELVRCFEGDSSLCTNILLSCCCL